MSTAAAMKPLTRKRILAMPAGPEMDTLIAEKVLLAPKAMLTSYSLYRDCPAYSTSPDAAWEVIDSFPSATVSKLLIGSLVPWSVLLYDRDRSTAGGYWAAGETMPLAACRAALLTLCTE